MTTAGQQQSTAHEEPAPQLPKVNEKQPLCHPFILIIWFYLCFVMKSASKSGSFCVRFRLTPVESAHIHRVAP